MQNLRTLTFGSLDAKPVGETLRQMNLTGTLVSRGADRMNTGAVGMEEEPPVESTQEADDEETSSESNERTESSPIAWH